VKRVKAAATNLMRVAAYVSMRDQHTSACVKTFDAFHGRRCIDVAMLLCLLARRCAHQLSFTDSSHVGTVLGLRIFPSLQKKKIWKNGVQKNN
jgi:hypothetical protein